MSRSGRVPVALVLGVLVLGLGLAPPAAAQGGPSARQAPTLERGARGAAVRQLQARLAELGYPLEVDGAFGPGTEAAVRAFQRDQRIQVDGQVGPETRG
ncbi:MAG: peptidoglycan-binding protein, partial [Planctomycetes bacterium]|nr:peptidoglycan-binding protein [Planctomycetota bacterium]